MPVVQIEESNEALRPDQKQAILHRKVAVAVDPLEKEATTAAVVPLPVNPLSHRSQCIADETGLDGGGGATPIEKIIIRGKPLQVPSVRHHRTMAEMSAEAEDYRPLFPEFQWGVPDEEGTRGSAGTGT